MIPRGRLRRFPFCSSVQVTYAEAWRNLNAATDQVAIASGIPRRLFAIDPAEFMVEAVLTSPPGLTEPELIDHAVKPPDLSVGSSHWNDFVSISLPSGCFSDG